MPNFGIVVAMFLAALITAAVACFFVRYPRLRKQLPVDVPGTGPQKFHTQPTPRIGGIPVFLGLLIATVALSVSLPSIAKVIALSLSCGLFAFAGGLAEDLTNRVGVRMRLLLTFASAALGFVFLDARISELDIPGFDSALQFTAVSFAFTLFAIGGFANAMNIVDGFNGLAGVVSLIFVLSIAYVAALVGDQAISWASLILGAALIGFLLLNFPRGLIFLGDGGAYLVGFLIAELVVMLVHRNSEVSPWFALTMLSYPIVETVFSIYRKKLLRRQSPGEPDGLHFHMLIYKRLVRRYRPANKWANPSTSPFLWTFALLGAAPSVMFWDNTTVLEVCMIVFVSVYVWLYWRIVHFRTPKPLIVRRWRFGAPSVESDENAIANASAE